MLDPFEDPENRQKALDELLVFQCKDFEGISEAVDGLPVTVRLLGYLLHVLAVIVFSIDT